MHPLDLTIIVLYLILMSLVGWWVSKKASQSAETYFLAGKSLPWWIIGVAHGSSGVDITGTMWFVTMFFIYGVKATWLLWVWPLFNVIFRMMYLGTWIRRSNVLTGAEWMRTRFGASRGAELAYLSVVAYALVSVVGFLSYAFRGIGKFTRPFFPWDLPDSVYATAMLLVTGVYCVVGGMYSVVMNDLIQFVLKMIAATAVAVIAIQLIQPEQIAAAVPAGWDQLFFGWRLDLDWSHLMPQLNERIYGASGDGYSLFIFFVSMLFLKGVLLSMAGPTPNYAIQHILSTRSPREAALENMVMAMVSLAPRFLLIAAIAVLGIVFYSHDLAAMGPNVDFEKILPNVVRDYVPIGFKGILIAALHCFVHEHLRLDRELRRGLCGQRYLQALHQPGRTAAAVCHDRLDHLELDDRAGDRLRPVHRIGPQGDRMDCLGPASGLRCAQRPQVALVAVQRLRFLRRDGCGDHCGRSQARGQHSSGFRVPADPGGELHRVDRRLPADPSRKVPRFSRASTAPCGPGDSGGRSTICAAPRIRSSCPTRISGATCSIWPSVWSGRRAW